LLESVECVELVVDGVEPGTGVHRELKTGPARFVELIS